ncbi:MAG: PstS family phosphate ABC transporter substrate-binding protein [Chloroflexota bacterium]
MALVAALALVLGACGSDDPTATPQPTATSEPASGTNTPRPASTPDNSNGELSGDIEIDGSSTVFPVTQAVAEEFRKEYPDVQVPVGISGTGGGFKRFVTGETVISNASRPIKDAEAQQAEENGVEYVELLVATDGLSVMVNPANDFVDCLTTDELKRLWEPGSEVDEWSDLRSEWPDEEISLFGPDTESGTFDYFTEAIVGEEDASRSNYQAAVDDNVLVRGISGDGDSLGYFGYAYYAQNQDQLKVVAIDNGDGCVEPSPETIESGDYQPLSRPLFIYVNTEALERPEVKEFVKFYLENADELATEVGYVQVTDERYQQQLEELGLN